MSHADFARGPASAPFPSDLAVDDAELADWKRLLEFGDDDARRLVAMNPLAREAAPAITEDFYRHLLSFEVGRVIFREVELLERVKRAQIAYFVRLTEGSYDLAYVHDRLRVGMLHERIGLPAKTYLGMFAFYLRAIARLLFAAGQPEEAKRSFGSFRKIIFLDMGLAMQAYMHQRELTIRLQQEAIRELSTPVLQLRPGLLLLPLVGSLDEARMRQMTSLLLAEIRTRRAKAVLLDVTGVPVIETWGATQLVQTVTSARLLGAATIITGLSPEIAQTLVRLGVDLGQIETRSDLRDGFAAAARFCGAAR